MPEAVKDTLIGTLLAGALALVTFLVLPLYLMPLGFLWIVALAALYMRYGTLPAVVACLLMGLAAVPYLGTAGFIGVAAVTGLALTALSLSLRPNTKAVQSVLYLFFELLAVVIVLIVVVSRLYGDVPGLITDYFRQAFDSLPEFWEAYSQSLGLPADYTLDSMLFELRESLGYLLPSGITGYCLNGAVFAVLTAHAIADARRPGERFARRFDIARWWLPKYTGWLLLGATGVCYIIYIAGVDRLAAAYNTFWQILYGLYILQGMAHLTFLMRRRGKKGAVIALAVSALFLLLKPALFALGVIDRINPVRRGLSREMIDRMREEYPDRDFSGLERPGGSDGSGEEDWPRADDEDGGQRSA